MFAPGITQVLNDFGTSSNILATFVVSVYVLGFAFGPLIVAPLSEFSGRTWVYNVCNILFVIFNIASALAPDMASLIVFRFLDGVAGVAAITCGSGTIADLVPHEKRGRAMSIWSLGPLFGPIIGPVVGGFLVEATNWRWVFWVLAIVVRKTMLGSKSTLANSTSRVELRQSSSSLLYRRRMRQFYSKEKLHVYENQREIWPISLA
jgi:multidrug resistance protein